MSEVRIAAEPRTEFGKGASRRARRAGKVPAVLYGHGTDPRHLNLPGHELMLALKTPNVLLRLDGLDKDNLALPKSVQRDAIKGFLEHVDLLVVTKGEKVEVELPITLTGEIKAGGVISQELVTVTIEAEATRIPSDVELSVEGMEVGTVVNAGDLKLPEGAVLAMEPDMMILSIAAAQVEKAQDEDGEDAAE
ncbi:50S ribosomal protein L25/general stress protein Ctc [Nocardiopsis algeriensis]|uniref:Large ribosomal subunit protein bL25 n=1 Tax=Nocardiopsis algeriensis TaxID=1478215 RepID=A0A841ILN8_9ACTN|nr:large subunit ribosomal protein L25 [Nocardiopsis algeriensis]